MAAHINRRYRSWRIIIDGEALWKCCPFLRQKEARAIEVGQPIATRQNQPRGISSLKQADIIKKLTALMSAEKGQFWHDLSSNFDTSDLNTNFDVISFICCGQFFVAFVNENCSSPLLIIYSVILWHYWLLQFEHRIRKLSFTFVYLFCPQSQRPNFDIGAVKFSSERSK